jgi:RNA polymerase-binding transcription factor DksA
LLLSEICSGNLEHMAKRKSKRPKATVADLLGTRPPRPRIPRKWQEAYERLARLRENFQRQESSLSEDAGAVQQHSGMHMADAGTDASERDLALGLISFDRDTVHQIDMAIERIRNGTYGICELTGKPISAERLKAIPWARFSASAEKQLEKEGIRRLAGAGRRDTGVPVEPGTEDQEEPEAE